MATEHDKAIERALVLLRQVRERNDAETAAVVAEARDLAWSWRRIEEAVGLPRTTLQRRYGP